MTPTDIAIVVTPALLAELKLRAAEANSLYHLARRVWKQQRRELASALLPPGRVDLTTTERS